MNRGVPSTTTCPAAARHWPYVSLLLAACAVAVHAVPGAAEQVQLDRAAVCSGEAWRLLTAHFAHFSTDHLAWDAAMFLILGTICERIDRRAFLLVIGSSALLIPAAVLLALPSITHYRGLSGIDSALFGLLAMTMIRENLRQRRSIGIIVSSALLVAFAMKIGIEMIFGVTVFADSAAGDFVPVPLAHAIGLLSGAACAIRWPAGHPVALNRLRLNV